MYPTPKRRDRWKRGSESRAEVGRGNGVTKVTKADEVTNMEYRIYEIGAEVTVGHFEVQERAFI